MTTQPNRISPFDARTSARTLIDSNTAKVSRIPTGMYQSGADIQAQTKDAPVNGRNTILEERELITHSSSICAERITTQSKPD